jgi:hypothetical protein
VNFEGLLLLLLLSPKNQPTVNEPLLVKQEKKGRRKE